MRLAPLVIAACGACGSSSSTAPPPPAPKAATPAVATAPQGPSEAEKRATIVAEHRKIEEEQQDALGATCEDPVPKNEHTRCFPSCYATEAADPRASKKLAGAVEIEHLVCQTDTGFVYADELDPKLRARVWPKRFPSTHRRTTWQATIESALHDRLPKSDVVLVTGTWRDLKQPLTRESLHCVTVAHYTRLHHPLGPCGDNDEVTCEAGGNAAARALNVIHYRLAEAKQLQHAYKHDDCQKAALEAVAVARGLPRWRQYAKLNVNKWREGLLYRTRFDGMLDEDALVTTASTLGDEAENVFTTCGGAKATTTPEQEQSFHACW